jgi:hypothetical protein
VVEDQIVGQRIDPRPSVKVDAEEEYHVAGVEDGFVDRNQSQYLIRSAAYDSFPWEPAKFGDGLLAVEESHLL